MKKNLVIGILSVVSLLSLAYAVYQKTIVNDLQHIAESSATEALRQKAIAEHAMEEALKQKALAEAAKQRLDEELTKSMKAK